MIRFTSDNEQFSSLLSRGLLLLQLTSIIEIYEVGWVRTVMPRDSIDIKISRNPADLKAGAETYDISTFI